jgi:hypothetical protein|nr:MAG TPA: hypothetical protein [Bacteriophage sp.]
MKKSIYNYHNFVALNMAEVEDFVNIHDDGYWDCEPVKFDADVYGLVKGRHAMPVSEYVFDEIEDMFNFSRLEMVAFSRIVKTSDTLMLYVTGLTVATVAVLNIAKKLGYKDVVLKHYNRDNGLYESQWVY